MTDMVAGVPLTTLLSWVWTAFTIEFDNEIEATMPHATTLSMKRGETPAGPWLVSWPMWANALRVIDSDGITYEELLARTGASMNLGGLERWGYVQVADRKRGDKGFGAGAGIKPDTVVRLTPGGALAHVHFPAGVDVVEERQTERFGSRVLTRLTKALMTMVDGEEGALPWSPTQVQPAQQFRTVVRAGERTGGSRPALVLLGQALTSVTLRHEQQASVPLPVAANFLRTIASETVGTNELPALAGVSKEASKMAETVLVRGGFASIAAKEVMLTKAGRAALDDYWSRASEIDDIELRKVLEEIVTSGSFADGMRPPPDSWRWEKQYNAQTEAFLAAPTSALPWQPMVLHRGGWPDGS